MGRAYTDALHHPVASLALSRDGLCVLAACLDSRLRLLDVEAGELLASYTGHTHASVRMGCAFTADDGHVIGCSEDGACVLGRACFASCAALWSSCVWGRRPRPAGNKRVHLPCPCLRAVVARVQGV